jgi:hypothetical protein
VDARFPERSRSGAEIASQNVGARVPRGTCGTSTRRRVRIRVEEREKGVRMHGCVGSTTNLWDVVGIVGCFAIVFTFLGWMLSRSRAAALEEQAAAKKGNDRA